MKSQSIKILKESSLFLEKTDLRTLRYVALKQILMIE